jgi:hypothetical protein
VGKLPTKLSWGEALPPCMGAIEIMFDITLWRSEVWKLAVNFNFNLEITMTWWDSLPRRNNHIALVMPKPMIG